MTSKSHKSGEDRVTLEEQVDAVFTQLAGMLPADPAEQRVHKNAGDKLKDAKNAVKAWDEVMAKRKEPGE